MGPKNGPTMPKAIVPPMTLTMITGMGVLSPRVIRNGLRTLSIKPTGTM